MPNPFKPTAGRIPPVLVGREEIIDDFDYAITDGVGSPGRLMFLTGARGVGKTVMLDALGERARQHGWEVVNESADHGFTKRLADALTGKDTTRISAYEMPSLGANGTLGNIELSLGRVELERKEERSLTLRQAVGARLDKMNENKQGILITLDEVQSGTMDEIRALSTAVQHLIREGRNIAFVFAGLPSAVNDVLSDNAITFLQRAERHHLGSVPAEKVLEAFEESFGGEKKAGMETLIRLTNATHGYPFMIQLVGYWAWRMSETNGHGERVTDEDAVQGIEKARAKLGDMVHAPALRGLPAQAINYLLAMSVDDGVSNTGEVARRMNRSPQFGNVYRTMLIENDLIEPVGYGEVTFKMPYLRDYLREHGAYLQMRENISELGGGEVSESKPSEGELGEH
ncbi:AAA family ATPase [Bifidobacterium panos]|uniref:AAA ATPase n=1 Tax=Bifidobacterium panos TaxID=2675321 RepID=A0ABX1SXQ8_9BIFI|nr:ATP-binding protein [Bifidobacterium sp. DSM 109963]NMN02610.1 AAA ATPase [Bifidobacterium sp. DSM 109963]